MRFERAAALGDAARAGYLFPLDFSRALSRHHFSRAFRWPCDDSFKESCRAGGKAADADAVRARGGALQGTHLSYLCTKWLSFQANI